MRPAVVALALALGGCQSMHGGGRPIHPSELSAGWLRAAPTPLVRQQREQDCGLAALAMIAGSWGMPWNIHALDEAVPASGGVKLGLLRDLARRHGLDAFAVRGTTADLTHELTAGRPVVVGLEIPIDRKVARDHYEVVVAINPRDGSIVTLDSASGDWLLRTHDVFDFEWSLAGNAALVVVGRLPTTASAAVPRS